MNNVYLSWKNLINRPLSLLLSVLLFALGIGLISLLLILNKQFQEKFERNMAGIDLVIGAKGSPLQLILSSMYHVGAPTGNIQIEEIKAFLNPKHPIVKIAVPLSLGDSYKGYRIIGTTHEYVDSIFYATVKEGTLWENEMEVTLGAAVATELKLRIGDTFFSAHGLDDAETFVHDEGHGFVVKSILNPTGGVIDQLILTNTASIWMVHEHEGEGDSTKVNAAEGHSPIEPHEEEIHKNHTATSALTDYPDKQITSLIIRYKNKKDLRALNMPRNINENTDMLAANPVFEINTLNNMMGAGTEPLKWIAIIITIVSAISIFISLYASLKERKYELALMRVMGSSPVKLFVLILLEGLFIALIGCFAGFAISHSGMSLLSQLVQHSYKYSFSGWVFYKEEWWILAAGLGIGVIAALIPAMQARNVDIHKTLA